MNGAGSPLEHSLPYDTEYWEPVHNEFNTKANAHQHPAIAHELHASADDYCSSHIQTELEEALNHIFGRNKSAAARVVVRDNPPAYHTEIYRLPSLVASALILIRYGWNSRLWVGLLSIHPEMA